MDTREIWLCTYSDLYKDLNGFRPRHAWLRTASVEELKAAVYRVANLLDEVLKREAADRAFEEALASNVAISGNGWSYTPAA